VAPKDLPILPRTHTYLQKNKTDIGTCEIRSEDEATAPQQWAALFGRLLSLVISISDAHWLLRDRNDALRPPQGRLKALRVTAPSGSNTPPNVYPLLESLLRLSALEEFGCNSEHEGEAVVDGTCGCACGGHRLCLYAEGKIHARGCVGLPIPLTASRHTLIAYTKKRTTTP
jgi:hypothetical protein